jgi:ribosomal protein L37AE/L43A
LSNKNTQKEKKKIIEEKKQIKYCCEECQKEYIAESIY